MAISCLNITNLVRPLFLRRIKAAALYVDYGEEVQRQELSVLLKQATDTEIGRKCGYGENLTYEQFRERVPIVSYEDCRDDIMRMVNGESNVLWRGVVKNFAQSSGTSDGRSKFIPISRESFKHCHYQGGFDTVAHYLNMNPSSRMFSGKGLILGGSMASNIIPPVGVKIGDLSANLIDNINPLANLVRIPSKEVALMEDWEKKLPAIVKSAIKQDVTNISGVPSWFLTVLKEVLKKTGASSIHDVWRNLEVFFHGGIGFSPYYEQYGEICDLGKMNLVETYNASEGFFAVQSSWDTKAMLLLLDIGVFFEFIPISELESQLPRAIPIWEVEKGKVYALLITANNGLWRYMIGDTVLIEQTAPVKIKIAGRTKQYINAFGEELMVHNAEEAISMTEKITGLHILDYTAAPEYATSHDKGRHQWLVEFSGETTTEDRRRFALLLDDNLRKVNSDYDAKRYKDIFLAPLDLIPAQSGLFNLWLKSTGKLGGQRKIPRLANDRERMEELLKFNNSTI